MTSTPAEVVGTTLLLAGAGDWDGYVDLFHEDAVFEMPFAPPGRPQRLAGRRELRDYLGRYPGRIEFVRLLELTVHETTDAEVVVVEMRAEGRVRATGAPYEMAYVNVVRVQEGLVRHYRDYWNPLMAAA